MRIFSNLQKIGKALMLPISILPAAGILLAFGDRLNIPLMTNAGGILFDNLSLLFAVGTAVGLAGESGIAALSSIVAILIINSTAGIVAGVTPQMALKGGAYTFVMGIPTLQSGVFGGLISGILGATMYNKFYTIQLPDFLGFFSGKRFVPIITAVFAFLIGLIFPTIWAPIQNGIEVLSKLANGENQALSTFIFGFSERALIPTGLHHIFYSPYWFNFGDYITKNGSLIHGDQTIWFKMFEEGIKSFSTDNYQNAGKFLQGEYPLMLFGLPAAALAMYHEALPKNKKIVAGIFLSAAFTCFLTGITEPIEFTFIFVAPILYIFNAFFAGISYMAMYLLNVHIAKSFSAGFIDFLSFGIFPSLSGYETNYLMVIIFGLFMGISYYFTFRILIRKFNLKTPGRDAVEENISKEKITDKELAALTINYLGGSDNIVSIDYCITRLRVEVKNINFIEEKELKNLGASGVVKVGKYGIQIIFGSKAQFIAGDIKKMITL
ncbi:PTS transporter subunit EIIC [uncultured Cetobacterium sp.]|uniref:PTS transporter subunit EIIC n=1 Tax=uncultured Cetobacterium sp. TaxID=527638 RepID=UPI002607F821|nr:PTS transporter subunit EIIC [uncultured Cetobacterium sp.]